MKNNDFAMLVVAILFIALASSGMNMITGSSSVTAEAGSVIEIPWSFKYTDGWAYGTSTNSRIMLDRIDFGGVNEMVWDGPIVDGQTKSGTFKFRVPDTEGEYKIKVIAEIWVMSKSRWAEDGVYYVTITVIPKPYDEPDAPVDPPVVDPPTTDDDLDSGVVPDDTPIDQTVEAAILGNSLMDKLSVLWDLIVTFFENLTGAK